MYTQWRYLMRVQQQFSYFDPLQKKIEAAERIIKEAYIKNNGNIYISCSFGKDSFVLRDIARRIYPNIPVVFSNTTNELPEILRFVKKFPDTIVVTPKLTFKQVIERFGFPIASKEISQKARELKLSGGRKTRMLRYYGSIKGNSMLPKKWRHLAAQSFNVSSHCCKILKKDPLELWAKKHDLKPLIALMKDESMLRQQLALYGDDGEKKIYPFLKSSWCEDDIWKYAKRFQLRFAECYYDRLSKDGAIIKAVKRSGCRDCDFGSHLMKEDKFERNKIAYPKSFAKTMSYKNNGINFSEARKLAHLQPKYDLGLYGGTVNKVLVKGDKEIYYYKLHTQDKSCRCCGKRKLKRDIEVTSSYIDTPNPITKRKRVVSVKHWTNKCSNCGMISINDLHFFELRFNVTKRVVDYIYDNLNKKTCQDITNETELPLADVFEIISFYYNKPIINAFESKADKIWFDKNNNLITGA